MPTKSLCMCRPSRIASFHVHGLRKSVTHTIDICLLCVCTHEHTEVTGQLVGVHSLPLPCDGQGSNLAHQGCISDVFTNWASSLALHHVPYRWHLGVQRKNCYMSLFNLGRQCFITNHKLFWRKLLTENFRLIILPSCGFLKVMIRLPSCYLARHFLLCCSFPIACLYESFSLYEICQSKSVSLS